MKLLRAVLLAVLTLGLVAVAIPASAAGSQTGSYVAISPARLLDTRTGTGAAKKPIGPQGTVALQIGGRGTVPSTGVAAVVANLTVVSPSSQTFIAVYPSGQQRPVGSSINVAAGKVRANQITVKLGSDGKLNLYNSSGSSNVVLDVVGYYLAGETAPSGVSGSGFEPSIQPSRVFDTRTTNAPPLAPSEGAAVSVSSGDAVTDELVTALAVNITVTGPTSAGFLNVWDGTGNPPITSAINFAAGQTVANTAIVRTLPCGEECGDDAASPTFVVINRAAGETNVVVDVVGTYLTDADDLSLRFVPLNTPRRIIDTRSGLGGSAFGSNQTRTLDPASVIGEDTEAVVGNVTGIAGGGATFLSMWPGGSRPATSNLNLAARETAANGAIVGLDLDGTFQAFNKQGPTNVIVDVAGRFDYLGTAAQAKVSKASKKTFTTVKVRRLPAAR